MHQFFFFLFHNVHSNATDTAVTKTSKETYPIG